MRAFAERVVGPRGSAFVDLAGVTIRNVARGVIGVALIQALLIGFGLIVAEVPAAGLLTLAVLVLGILQVGAAPVVIPLLIWVWATRDTTPALLLTLYLIPAMLADNALKPLLMRKGLETPVLVILAGVIGGTISYGLIGLFLGPVVLAVFYDLLRFWMAEDPFSRSGPAASTSHRAIERRAAPFLRFAREEPSLDARPPRGKGAAPGGDAMIADASTADRSAFDRTFDVCVIGAGPAGITARPQPRRRRRDRRVDGGRRPRDHARRARTPTAAATSAMSTSTSTSRACASSAAPRTTGVAGPAPSKPSTSSRALGSRAPAGRSPSPISTLAPASRLDPRHPLGDRGPRPADAPGRLRLPPLPVPLLAPHPLRREVPAEVEASPGITLVLNANLVDLRLDDALNSVTGAVFRSYDPADPGFTVGARALRCAPAASRTRACSSTSPARSPKASATARAGSAAASPTTRTS